MFWLPWIIVAVLVVTNIGMFIAGELTERERKQLAVQLKGVAAEEQNDGALRRAPIDARHLLAVGTEPGEVFQVRPAYVDALEESSSLEADRLPITPRIARRDVASREGSPRRQMNWTAPKSW